jgi:hypothetical protein
MSFERFETRISTPIGDVWLTPTSADHIHAENGRNSLNGDRTLPHVHAPFNIRGVEIAVSIHYHKWSDGRWHIGREDQSTYERRQSLYASRLGSLKDISESARKRIEEVLDIVVNAFAENNAYILTAANVQDLADKLDSANHDYDKAEKAFDAASIALHEAETALYNATGVWPSKKVTA